MPRTWPGSWPPCWRGDASDRLLESYHAERRAAALENLAVTDATHALHGPARAPPSRAPQRDPAGKPAHRAAAAPRQLGSPGAAVHLRRLADRGAAARRPAPSADRSVVPDAACHPARRDGRADAAARPDRRASSSRLLVLRRRRSRAPRRQPSAPSRLAWPAPCEVVVIGPDAPLSGVIVLADASRRDPARLRRRRLRRRS